MSKLSLQRGVKVCLAATVFSWSPAGLYAQQNNGSADELQGLIECRAIAQDIERLACFDREVALVSAKQESGEVRVVRAEDIRETRRGLFGFSTPKTGLFASSDEADDKLQSRITGVRQVRSDYWEVTIAEGSVWRASDTPRRFKPRVGDTVELERAALGSYWLRVNGTLGVKARRIE